MSQLSKEECLNLHQKNAGEIVWLENLADNDLRLVLKNQNEILTTFMSAEYDMEEQAQAARLCAAINMSRKKFI